MDARTRLGWIRLYYQRRWKLGAAGGANVPHRRVERHPDGDAARLGRSGRELVWGSVLALTSPTDPQAIALAVHLVHVDVVLERVAARAGVPFLARTLVHSSNGRLLVTRTEPRS